MKAAIIGFGKMGQAIAKGWIDKKVFNPEDILASSGSYDRLMDACEKLNTTPMPSNAEAIANADVVILAVKPKMIADAMQECRDLLAASDKWIVSVAWGIDCEEIEKLLPGSHHISTIPNTAIEAGCGIMIYENQSTLTQDQKALFVELFEPVSMLVEIPKAQMNIAGILGGCAPAFTEMYLEALGDAGVAYGLKREQAYEIAAKMIEGVGVLYLNQKNHPGMMKDDVCSPGGSTIRGVMQLEKEGFRSAVISAVQAIADPKK